ncbi:MAG: prepilin-type N-terminal cleavage/methylation domain-containing protein, partial [Acidobacteriota bacterium]
MSIFRVSRKGSGEAGFTLAEVLISMAIFVIASTVAFLLYDNAQRSFKRGEEATEQQQVTRVAFDKVISDLRSAGFNYNPTGNPNRTDEQIEGAWATAVSFRSDSDAEDPTESLTPETTLASGVFDVVSTGNDEIVTYVLAKDGGSTGGETLTFFADVSSPRDTAAPDQVDINNVALTAQSDPPYTLYRVTLDTSGAAVKEPLADNLRSLSLTYYDANGTLLDPANMGGSEANVDERARIRRITVDVVGMTPNDDIRYLDPADSDPDTQRRRKFNLVSDVQVRNLGMVGAADLDTSAPSTPTGLSACAGHCGGLVMDWNLNPTSEGVQLYNIKWGTSASSLNSFVSAGSPVVYGGGLSDASNYYMAIQAQDSAGNKSQWSATLGPLALASDTFPLDPQNPAATSVNTQIDLSWDIVTENTDAGASAAVAGCDPDRPVRRDAGGYKVYRLKNPGGTFNLTDTGVGSFTSATNSYTDSTASLCATYGYRITAIDAGCTDIKEGAPSVMVTAATTAVAELAAPAFPTAARDGTGNDGLLTWDPVTQDTDSPPNSVSVDSYNVVTAVIDTSLGENPSTATYNLLSGGWNCTTPTSCRHTNGGSGITPPLERWYKVAAATDCSFPYDEGLLSDPFVLGCFFDGTIIFTTPANGAQVTAGTVPIEVDVSGAGTYTQATFTILDLANSTTESIGPISYSAGSPNFAASWNGSGRSGQHRITAAVTEAGGCVGSQSITVDVVTPVPCCFNVTSVSAITQGASEKKLEITFDNLCGVDLSVNQFTILTDDLLGNDTELKSAAFDGGADFFTNAGGQAIEGAPFVHVLSVPEALASGTHTLDL